MQFVRFFLGTPQRFIGTVVIGTILYAIARPNDVAAAVNRTFGALFGPLATLAILVIVFRMIIGGRR